MIGRLKGQVDVIAEDHVLLDVHGVGYEVFCPRRILASLQPGTAFELSIDTHMREDRITLYGFASLEERQWFRWLQLVQGVGARVALAILDVAGPDDLIDALARQDTATLTRANGVGPKLAKRIALELKDRLPETALVHRSANAQARPAAPASSDAAAALVNLGLSRHEAENAVFEAARTLGAAATTETLIKEALAVHASRHNLERRETRAERDEVREEARG